MITMAGGREIIALAGVAAGKQQVTASIGKSNNYLPPNSPDKSHHSFFFLWYRISNLSMYGDLLQMGCLDLTLKNPSFSHRIAMYSFMPRDLQIDYLDLPLLKKMSFSVAPS